MFSDGAYLAMLFSRGVATGLWHYTAEGMWYYEGYGNPLWTDTKKFNINTRADHALIATYFHSGVHAWIPYSMIGALLAILHCCRGFPPSMRRTLYPITGEMCYGIAGDLYSVFGICTSFGLGALQINQRLMCLDHDTYRRVDYIPDGNTGITFCKEVQIVIILGITILATMRVVAGLKSGIAVLAQIAFGTSVLILGSMILLNDTWYILNADTSVFGYYLQYLPKISVSLVMALDTVWNNNDYTELGRYLTQCFRAGPCYRYQCNDLAISATEKGQQWKKAPQLFVHMQDSSLQLDAINYNTAISTCEKGEQWEKDSAPLGPHARLEIAAGCHYLQCRSQCL